MTDPVPQVTAVLTAFDCADEIDDAIERLTSLSYPNLQIVLVDDASTDGTTQRCLEAEAADGAIRTITHPRNRGVAAARASGVEAATGDFIWFCDADDRWSPEIVTAMASAASRTGSEMICCRARRREMNGRTWIMEGVDEERTVEADAITGAVLSGTVRGYLWNKLIRRDVLVPLVERDHLSSQDDFMTVLDALARTNQVTLIPDVLYEYRELEHSISSTDELRLENTAACYARVADLVEADRSKSVDATAQLAYFRLWFLGIPCITTPAHHGWPAARAEQMRRQFRSSITWRGIRAALSHNPRTAAHGALIKLSGPGFARLYRAVGPALGFAVRSTTPDADSRSRS